MAGMALVDDDDCVQLRSRARSIMLTVHVDLILRQGNRRIGVDRHFRYLAQGMVGMNGALFNLIGNMAGITTPLS
jgi:hypothetical protein